MSMWKRKRQKVRSSVPETLPELIWRTLGLWGIPLRIVWAAGRSILCGGSLLLSSWPGRVVAGIVAGMVLLDAGFGSDEIGVPLGWLPVSNLLVVLAVLVAAFLAYLRRRIWEEHVESVVYDVVPGHSASQPAVVWYPPNLYRYVQLGRWFGRWELGFRVPGAMKEAEEQEVTTQLRSRLPAARGSSWMIDWNWRKGTARATLVEDVPDALSREDLLIRVENEDSGDRDRIPLGVSVDGVEFFDVEQTPHLLNTGETGNGKSVAQLGIVCHALEHADAWEVVGCDPKKVELGYLEGRPGVREVARDLPRIARAVKQAEKEMDERFDLMQRVGVNHIRNYDPDAKRLLIVVDELQQVTMPSNAKDEESKAADEIKLKVRAALERIAALGRAAGVHLCLTTQRPDVTTGILTGPLKFNLSGRIACGRMDSTASTMALDTDSATQLPRQPKGRAIWRGLEGDKQIQVVYTVEHDLPETAREEVAA